MKELVIDGSFEDINLSIFDSKELIYDLHIHPTYTHSKILTDIFDCAFKSLAIDLNDIDNFYCCTGPGKYTSLRVTLATIKGMLFDKEEYVYGFSSLDLMAAEETGYSKLRIACKTSRTKIYFADYIYTNENIERLGEIKIVETINSNDEFKTKFKNTISSTRHIFKIHKKQIKKIKVDELAPLY